MDNSYRDEDDLNIQLAKVDELVRSAEELCNQEEGSLFQNDQPQRVKSIRNNVRTNLKRKTETKIPSKRQISAGKNGNARKRSKPVETQNDIVFATTSGATANHTANLANNDRSPGECQIKKNFENVHKDRI